MKWKLRCWMACHWSISSRSGKVLLYVKSLKICGEVVRQEVRPPQLVEGRDDLAVGEIARRPEQDEDARIGDALEPEAFAERVVVLPGRRLALALARLHI